MTEPAEIKTYADWEEAGRPTETTERDSDESDSPWLSEWLSEEKKKYKPLVTDTHEIRSIYLRDGDGHDIRSIDLWDGDGDSTVDDAVSKGDLVFTLEDTDG